MEAIAHNPGFAKKVGIPQSVGKDFYNADKGKSFSKGGDMATKMDPKMLAMLMAKKKGMAPPGGGMSSMGARPPMASPVSSAPPMGMKRGGTVKKMATGGFTRAADGVASKGKTKAKQIKMNRGGLAC